MTVCEDWTRQYCTVAPALAIIGLARSFEPFLLHVNTWNSFRSVWFYLHHVVEANCMIVEYLFALGNFSQCTFSFIVLITFCQWHLFIKMATDWQVSEVGDTSTPAAGAGRSQLVQIEWISAWTAHLEFPALLSVPHLLAHEIIMNRHHSVFTFLCYVL